MPSHAAWAVANRFIKSAKRNPHVPATTTSIHGSFGFRGASGLALWRETVAKNVKNAASSMRAETGRAILHRHAVTFAAQRSVTPAVQRTYAIHARRTAKCGSWPILESE